MVLSKHVLISLFLFINIQLSINAQTSVEDFLNVLDKSQREKANLPFEDASRETWHFLPGTMYKRAGIALYELSKPQKKIAFNFLKSQLSEIGYLKTKEIIGLENILAEISGDSIFRDPEKYYIAVYGNPVKDDLWAWSFEGHHITLNFTVIGDKTSISPRFFGANPARVKDSLHNKNRILNKEEDLAFELINSMSEDQKKQTIFQSKSFNELITKNDSKVRPLKAVGIEVSSLNKNQQNILITLIKVYLSSLPEKLAKERFESVKESEFNTIRFGWAGSTNIKMGHYYRIQGSTFLIEFDNTQNSANHIHTVWRDFNGDFGRDLIREHYNHDHNH